MFVEKFNYQSMAAPVPPGDLRPNNNNQRNSGPPFGGYQGNANALADNMHNLSMNRPPSMMPGSGPRPPPPFGQFPKQSPYGAPQRGPSPMARPGPPPPAAGMGRPSGPPPVGHPTGFPSNAPLGRPTGPPPSQPPFGSRPSMPGGPAASSSGFPAFGPSGPPPGARPMGFGSPPPVGSGVSMPPPSGMLGGPVSNGPQVASSGGFPRGPQFPGGAVSTPQSPYAQPPASPFVRAPPQPLGAPQSAPPSMLPPTFPGAPHGRPAVSGLPYGPPSGQV